MIICFLPNWRELGRKKHITHHVSGIIPHLPSIIKLAGISPTTPAIYHPLGSTKVIQRVHLGQLIWKQVSYRVKLLAYSPIAMGLLSGKYLLPDDGAADAHLNRFRGRYSEEESRYNLSNPTIREAIKAYISIAEHYDIHPVSLAIARVSGPL